MLSALWFRGPIRYRRIRLRWSIKKVDGVELNFRYRISPRKRKTRLTNCTQWAPRKEMKKRSPKIDEEPSVSGGTNWKRGETQKKRGQNQLRAVWRCASWFTGVLFLFFSFFGTEFHRVVPARRSSKLGPVRALWLSISLSSAVDAIKEPPFPNWRPSLITFHFFPYTP